MKLARTILALGTAWFAIAVPAATQPNLIFILADDLGWRDLGCYGSSFYETPNLDRLAKQGMRFTAAYAACNVCSPTRASILTGKYPARLNLTDWLPGRPNRPDQKLNRPVIQQHLPLEELALDKNTVIVFTSDNGGLSTAEGTPTSNVPLRLGKGWNYEGGLREPLLVKWPGVTQPGSRCDEPMISTDYAPLPMAPAPKPATIKTGKRKQP